MPYTPPAGNQVGLKLRADYTPPPGNQVGLRLGPDVYVPPEPITRVLFAQSRMRWRRGRVADRSIRLPLGNGAAVDVQPSLRWTRPATADRGVRLPWDVLRAIDIERRLPISPGAPREHQARLPWQNPKARDTQGRMQWGVAAPADDAPRGMPWSDPPARDRQARMLWSTATPIDHEAWLATGKAVARDMQIRLPWGMSAAPAFRYLLTPPPPPVPPPPGPCYVPPPGNQVGLRMLGGYLPPPGHQVGLQLLCGPRRYFKLIRTARMSHSLSVVRLPDRLPLKVLGVGMSIDRESWTWSVQQRFADRASLIAVAPQPTGPQSVEITLDGYVWTSLVEGYQEDRRFGSKTASANGRSRTALLADPYRAERAFALDEPATAQQLALAELEFTDFGLDWQIDDWTVPAGAWAYDRETPISAIIRIAKAAGAMVQSAPGSDTILVKPLYPVLPWLIADAEPDMTIAAGSALTLSKRHVGGKGYEGVWISGQLQGVRVHVYIDGTDGSPEAELVVDPLITDVVPARHRGGAVIADSITHEDITVLLPLMPSPAAPGLLVPGTLLVMEDTVWGVYRALVTSVDVSADYDDEGLLTARQAVGVRRFLL